MTKASWLEVYKKGGEWKVADGPTGRVVRTADTKKTARGTARQFMRTGYGDATYIAVQVYKTNGMKDEVYTSASQVKSWARRKSRTM